ncbi:hypothetical protein [Euzebya tangerina]|uniref:hypothetical protein n=1 Tax=Euzebya tangerina TaxID=591198 RepID=UPI000E318ED0|nr:hypothetical protein [Euzebya tangerina]
MASNPAESEPDALVDFTQVPRRLQTAVVVSAALALLGCVVDGAINGLTFALMGRWGGIFVLVALLSGAAVTAIHALGGADRAGQRGERLAGPDVGLSPRRFEGRGLLHKADAVSAAAATGSAASTDEPELDDTQRLDPVQPDPAADESQTTNPDAPR